MLQLTLRKGHDWIALIPVERIANSQICVIFISKVFTYVALFTVPQTAKENDAMQEQLSNNYNQERSDWKLMFF